MSNTENQKEDTTFLDAYLDAMLWTEEERLEKELGSPAGLVDLSFETITRVRKECKRFLTKEVKILINGHEEQAGHDFWLTRNGHGAGFWDRTDIWDQEARDFLTERAKQFGEVSLYVGDDKKIYTDL